jgi:putative peptidoglycan lipid II flippase
MVFVDRIMGSYLNAGSVSYLGYAAKLNLFIVLLSSSVSTVFFPYFSSSASKKDLDSLSSQIQTAIKATFFITIPSTFGLLILGEEVISVIFQRGAFDVTSTHRTYVALLCYCMIPIMTPVAHVVASAYYSLKDTKSPVIFNFMTFLINVSLNYILMIRFGFSGIAIASSISQVLLMSCMYFYLPKRNIHIDNRLITVCVCKILFCASLMVVVIMSIKHFILVETLFYKITLVAGLSFVGGIVYIFFAYVVGLVDIKTIQDLYLQTFNKKDVK